MATAINCLAIFNGEHAKHPCRGPALAGPFTGRLQGALGDLAQSLCI